MRGRFMRGRSIFARDGLVRVGLVRHPSTPVRVGSAVLDLVHSLCAACSVFSCSARSPSEPFVTNIVARLITAAKPQNAIESFLRSRMAVAGTVVHTDATSQDAKLTRSSPKNVHSRQQRVSDSNPKTSTIQTAAVAIDCQSCDQEKSLSCRREYE